MIFDASVGATARSDLDWARLTAGIEGGYTYQAGALVTGLGIGLSAFDAGGGGADSTVTQPYDLQTHVVRAGIDYRF